MRRKKTRLSSQTLSTVISMGRPPDIAEPPEGSASGVDLIEFNILDLLRSEPEESVVPAAYNEAGSMFTGAADFPSERFVFGLMICPACRNEMIYYQERDRLLAGYPFRCRVCQHPLLACLS